MLKGKIEIQNRVGYLRYDHIGEGGYAETEKVQSLLQERAAQIGLDTNLPNINNNTITGAKPENVQSVDFGYQFARVPLGNPEGFRPDQSVKYLLAAISSDLKPNIIYLDGTWKNNADNMELQS